MPLVPAELPPGTKELHQELSVLARGHGGGIDSFLYNGGTIASLIAAGAAGVLANEYPLVAASLSAATAFLIAMMRILNFGARWTWQLSRRATYSALIYDLNAVSLLPSSERATAVQKIYSRLSQERLLDGLIPGVTDSAQSPSPGIRPS